MKFMKIYAYYGNSAGGCWTHGRKEDYQMNHFCFFSSRKKALEHHFDLIMDHEIGIVDQSFPNDIHLIRGHDLSEELLEKFYQFNKNAEIVETELDAIKIKRG